MSFPSWRPKMLVMTSIRSTYIALQKKELQIFLEMLQKQYFWNMKTQITIVFSAFHFVLYTLFHPHLDQGIRYGKKY